jgi:predicted dehydrogenase
MTYQRDFERRLRIGVVGVGHHSYRNILPALHYLPVDLVALCDVNADLLRSTAQEYRGAATYTSTAAMYEQEVLDAVLICTGPLHHPGLAIEAMQAGLHVWTEKPPAMRVEGVDRMIEARGDRVCSVGFKKAYMPATRKTLELIALPEFGALRSILAVYPMTIPRDGAALLDQGKQHNWLANGIHPLSLMLAVGGSVDAVTTLRGPGEDAVGVVMLQFANGAIGTFHLAGGAPRGQAIERYECYGSGQSVVIDNSTRVEYLREIPFVYQSHRNFIGDGLSSGTISWQANHALATLENKALFVQGIYDELLDFCEAILVGRPLQIATLEFARHLMQVYEAALLSNGQPVAIA